MTHHYKLVVLAVAAVVLANLPAGRGDEPLPPPPGLQPPPGQTTPGLGPALPDLDHLLPSLALTPEPGAMVPPLTGGPGDRTPLKASTSNAGGWGALTGTIVLDDDRPSRSWEDPLWKRSWKADQSWKCPVFGSVTAFGQVGGNGEEAGQSDLKFSGRTGLEWKVPVWLAELQLRSGPGVSYTDPLRPDRMRERSDWLVDVQARCPLLFGIGLEYQGTALPALTPLAQDEISQDLRLAFPLGPGGKFKLGARQTWAGTTEARQWTDTTQLYLGFELAR
jgi:hypothetical protein